MPNSPVVLGEPLTVAPPLTLAVPPRKLPVVLPLPLGLASTDMEGDGEFTPDTEGDLEEEAEKEGEWEAEGDPLGLLELVLAREVAMAEREILDDREEVAKVEADLDGLGELEGEGLSDPSRRLGVKEGESVIHEDSERTEEGDMDPSSGDSVASGELLGRKVSEG